VAEQVLATPLYERGGLIIDIGVTPVTVQDNEAVVDAGEDGL
jgi:hypothetical protein